MPPGTPHNALDLGPDTGMMLSSTSSRWECRWPSSPLDNRHRDHAPSPTIGIWKRTRPPGTETAAHALPTCARDLLKTPPRTCPSLSAYWSRQRPERTVSSGRRSAASTAGVRAATKSKSPTTACVSTRSRSSCNKASGGRARPRRTRASPAGERGLCRGVADARTGVVSDERPRRLRPPSRPVALQTAMATKASASGNHDLPFAKELFEAADGALVVVFDLDLVDVAPLMPCGVPNLVVAVPLC